MVCSAVLSETSSMLKVGEIAKEEPVCLGIDTSNYTTSAALCTKDGRHISLRIPFDVAMGERGVRQSDAVFLHTKALPQIMEEIAELGLNITSVAVSSRPRDVEGSYMPCFLAGMSVARSIAAAKSIPLYTTSHQNGHVYSILLGSNQGYLIGKEFFAYHVSGGTTELLKVEVDGSISIIAETADINIGQLVDRCGIKLGLKFPCGVELERLANNGKNLLKPMKFKAVKQINLSGLENKFADYIKTNTPEDAALWLFESISNALIAMASEVTAPLLLAGGVMSNCIIKSRLSEHFDIKQAGHEYAADNAIGVAWYGALHGK